MLIDMEPLIMQLGLLTVVCMFGTGQVHTYTSDSCL